VTLNDADRLKLAEIERQFQQDPTIARVFRTRRRTPWKLAGSAVCAILAYLVCLVTVSLLTGGGIPVPLAVLPVAITVALLLRPGVLQWPALRRRRR
jgi:hypothetical protein